MSSLTCAGCKQPITDATFIWTGEGVYHNGCLPPSNVTFTPPFGGLPLTEERVRQIVREELLRASGVLGTQEPKENDRG